MKHDLEYYPTPKAFTAYLQQSLESRLGKLDGVIFEPAVGDGAIMKAIVADDRKIAWATNDLDTQWEADTYIDATLDAAWPESIDWVISNPPFSCAVEISQLALKHAKVGVAMHLRASIHEVLREGPRRTWLREHPPNGILWLPRFAYRRSRRTGKWSTDSMASCWVIWLKDRADQFIEYAPEWVLEQLSREKDEYRALVDMLTLKKLVA